MTRIAPFGFVLVAACAAAQAQDETPVELETMQVTAGRLQEDASAVPQPVTVLGRDQIERATPQVMTDLLRGQPGVFLQSSGPGQGIAIIRGLKGSEVLHLVDGMRLNMTFFRNSPSQYIALVDPYNIQQVEVLRGPAATLYGSDAMGGVLQVLTPEHAFYGDERGARGGTLVQLGTAELARVGHAWAATGNHALSLAGGFTYQDYGLRDLGGDGGREPWTNFTARGGDLKLLGLPAVGHELMLSASWFEMPQLPRYFEIVGGPGGPGSNNGLPVFFQPGNRRFVHARYRVSVPVAFVDSVEAHLGEQVINDDRVRLVTTTTREQEQNRSTLHGFTTQLISSAGPAKFVYGFDLYRDAVDSAKSRTNLTTDVTTPRDGTFPDGAEEQSRGIYGMAEWRPVEPWLVEVALRYSQVSTDLPATSASAATTIDNDDVTGHLGSAFSLTRDLVWTANFARGFRAPNIFDLGTLGPRPNTSPQQVNVPNPTLRPETILSADTGLKWFAGPIAFETSVFVSRYDDRIEPREPTGNTIPAGTLGCADAAGCVEVRSENISQARYHGVESGARYRRPGVEAYATFNYTRGEEEKRGTSGPANRVPPLNGQAGVRWEVQDGVFVEPWVLFADRQNRLDDDDRNDVRIDPAGTAGWISANLRLGWNPRPSTRLQLDLRNLLDESYREHGSGVDAAGLGGTLTAELRFD